MRKPNHPQYSRSSFLAACKAGLCLSGALIAAGAAVPNVHAQSGLAQENEDLKKRVDALENMMKKEGIMPSGTAKAMPVKALSEISISGFVQASYFYDTSKPSDRASDAYLWNTAYNSFSINKVKLTIASKPVETDKWDAGFRASMMWGEDSQNLNSPPGGGAAPGNTGFQDLREAFVELNVPIGTGLNIKAGELISLLNFESGDGGAANPNFSQGNQWWFTGNGPSAGIQLGYAFTEKVGLTLRMDNGLFQGPVDANDGKALSASLALKPTKNFWINFVPFYSANEFAGSGTDVLGIDIIGGGQITEQFGVGFEFDYFHFDNSDNAGASDADVWSLGGWAWYDFSPKVGVALRADYIDSPDGVLGPPVRPGAGIGSAGTTTDTDGALGSVTLTLNLKPAPNIKIQPELRYDYTSFNNGLDGHDSRFIVGCGISYLF